ncbi:H(+)/Cl(-) exchange transporter 6-like [Amphiura filiformis]|uniref:H(+)/Cl(-) exchange transporter 6-like n=1 Tax=Amphiura filiformis TaxID=82378 RepID=UPI003B2163C0
MSQARRCCCCAQSDEDDEEMSHIVDTVPQTSTRHAHLPRKDYESLDYDVCYSKPYLDMTEARNTWSSRHLELFRWIVTFSIGICTGLVAVFIDYFVRLLSKLKFGTVEDSILQCSQDGCLVISLLIIVAIDAAFVFIASSLVAIEPIAGGSGIPEIKCYLNGIKVPHVVRLKTLISKAVGVLFSVAGGLFVGKEGPMIHSGAIVGAGIPQFQSITFRKLNFNFPYFRTDRDKRDFVSGGAAAGVAAAFGSPIGGVLFSLEEGSSFWNQALTWRTFFCAMSATFCLNFMLSGLVHNKWGALDQPGLINFGIFTCPESNTDSTCNLWTAYDLLLFIVMGLGGGLLGALFNFINSHLTVYRYRHVNARPRYVRVLESVLIAVVTTSIAFVAAMTLGECKDIKGPAIINGSNAEVGESVRTYFCENGTYNDMATLFFNSQETAIKQLFHQQGTFSLPSLAIFFVFFFFLSCWTYGAMVPSGLFVPCLLCGAAYGRFIGNVLNEYVGYRNIYSGSFALMGSAAFLGGVVRMTISLTVILIESTNEISYGLPIMVVLMVAKWSGDLFNKGLYDIHVHLKGVPHLEWEASKKVEKLRVHEIMETNLTYLYPHTRVRSVISILRTTMHHAYPIITDNTRNEDRDSRMVDSALETQNTQFKKEHTLTRAKEQLQRRESQMSIDLQRMRSSSTRMPNDRRAADEFQTSQSWSQGAYFSSEIRHRNSSILNEESDRPRAASMEEEHRNHPVDIMSDLSNDSQTDSRDIEDDYRPLTFHGVILRSHLVALLKKGVCYAENSPSSSQRTIKYEELTEDYPRYPDIHDIDLSHINRNMIMDLTQYMNPCPYTVSPETPVSKVFNLFRTMGLRHLEVVNSSGEILGIVTRHNLTEEFLDEKLKVHERNQEEMSESDVIIS